MRVIDLSHKLYDGMPNYPSDPPVSIIKKKYIDSDRSVLHQINIGTHTGTHLDVPMHIKKNGKTLSDYNINSFFGKAIKVTPDNYHLSLNVIELIDVIIFETGWYKNYPNPDIYFGKDRPRIPNDLLNICLENGIKIFGCDLPSIDSSGSKKKPNHNLLLGNDIIIYESLNNLDKIPVNMIFMFYGFPLSLSRLDGSPVRAVGIIK